MITEDEITKIPHFLREIKDKNNLSCIFAGRGQFPACSDIVAPDTDISDTGLLRRKPQERMKRRKVIVPGILSE